MPKLRIKHPSLCTNNRAKVACRLKGFEKGLWSTPTACDDGPDQEKQTTDRDVWSTWRCPCISGAGWHESWDPGVDNLLLESESWRHWPRFQNATGWTISSWLRSTELGKGTYKMAVITCTLQIKRLTFNVFCPFWPFSFLFLGNDFFFFFLSLALLNCKYAGGD